MTGPSSRDGPPGGARDRLGSSAPEETETLDLGWDEEDDPASRPPTHTMAPPTRRVSPMSMPVDVSQRATMPPPMKSEEYVDTMMAGVRDSIPEGSAPPPPHRHRAPLPTLLEIDPLQFDQPEAEETPSIETSYEEEDVSPELLVNTMPPPDGHVDEMDMLPFDEVLAAITDRETPSPVSMESEAADVAPGLRLGAILPTSMPAATEEPDFDAATPPGGVDVASLGQMSAQHVKLARRVELRDYAGALMLAETLVASDPNDAHARRCAEQCRTIVIETYIARLGDRRHVARVVLGREALQGLTLDHRAGFLLSCIEGSNSLDDILDLSGMPTLETVRLLWELVQEGVVAIDPPVR